MAKGKSYWRKEISNLWISWCGDDPAEWQLSGKREEAVDLFLNELSGQDVIEALSITKNRIELPADSDDFRRYFCGVCWNKIKSGET